MNLNILVVESQQEKHNLFQGVFDSVNYSYQPSYSYIDAELNVCNNYDLVFINDDMEPKGDKLKLHNIYKSITPKTTIVYYSPNIDVIHILKEIVKCH